ncbi:LL-diaminopimelate aminotransferase [candidate division KSB1 bacterium]|nr:LL-diaminopimelate aminotransferase [candidate division KSB1 bacterium]
MARLNSNYKKLAAGYLFPEITRRVQNYLKDNPDTQIMKLGIGNTTEPLTPTIIQGLHQGVDKLASIDSYTGYGEYHGELPIRTALQNMYRTYNVNLDPEEFFVSDGAKPDSANLQSIFYTDSIVAVQDPAYPVYVDSNVIAGRSGTFNTEKGLYEGFIYMPCTESNGFFPELPSQKVDLIYLCSPNNPTGAVATKEQLKLFVDYALENQAIIFFDAAYSAFIHDPSLPRSIYEVEGAKKCAIEINSFSKVAGFTGVRLGWAVVPFELKGENIQPGDVNKTWMRRQSTFFNGPSNIVQAGGVAALSDQGQKECNDLVTFYMNNAKLIRKGLDQMGLTIYGGDNAPYVWLKTPNEMTSWEFFDKLLIETHVVGTPGSGFGPSGEGFFRLSAFGHADDIVKAIQSIQENLRI